MNLVDIVAIIAIIGYAYIGYRNGVVEGALSLGGFLLGAVIGGQLAGPTSTWFGHGTAKVLVAIVVVVLSALIVQAAGVWLAVQLRRRVTRHRSILLDSGLGAVLGVVAVVVVIWMLALPLASSPFLGLTREIRESHVVHGIDNVMPGPIRSAYSALRSLANRDGFPEVFGELQASHIYNVAPPDSTLTGSAAVTRARASIVKVVASSKDCDQGSEGSGFVYAPGRVITNAHVVAGMSEVSVLDDGTRSARVVLFDPTIDVAVLQVKGLRGKPLAFATSAAVAGQSAIVAGYPEDGPFDPEAARIRDVDRAYGKNIYGSDVSGHSVGRDIYSLRALVRPGNSGGPLLSTDGHVLGIVFARALDVSDTGYALTAGQVAGDVTAGRRATAAVSTRSCIDS